MAATVKQPYKTSISSIMFQFDLYNKYECLFLVYQRLFDKWGQKYYRKEHMFCMKICLNLVYPQELSIYFCIYNFLFKWIRYQSVFKGNKGFQYRISGNFRENLIFAFYAITYILQKIQYAEIISRIFNFAIFSANFFDMGKKLRIYGISMYFLK